jgi:D-glycero-D-manno-heptose 1,7-bisphosphate phosphatase
MTKRFVLIDRDGTVNVEKHYLANPEDLELIPSAGPAIKRLQLANWGICLVTNQSGIARGYFDLRQLHKVHQRLLDLLGEHGAKIDGIYFCPHAPDDGCNCRKPSPGMVYQAVSVHGFDPRQAWVIGDKEVDVELGHAVGATTILVRTGYGKDYESETNADYVTDDLGAAINLLLERNG